MLFFIVVIFPGCKTGLVVKPMKYERNGEQLACDGYYNSGQLVKVICFTHDRDTLLIENYKSGAVTGYVPKWHPNGILEEAGMYDKNRKIGEWRSFYPSGGLKSFQYYNPDIDSVPLFYEKTYNEVGEMMSLRYPLRLECNERIIATGDTAILDIELMYSEFINGFIVVILDESSSDLVTKDTLISDNLSLQVELTPKEAGKHRVSGVLIELDGGQDNYDDGYGGEKDFVFDFLVVD